MRHTLDVMRLEKNVALIAVGFLLKETDIIAVCKDMHEAQVMED